MTQAEHGKPSGFAIKALVRGMAAHLADDTEALVQSECVGAPYWRSGQPVPASLAPDLVEEVLERETLLAQARALLEQGGEMDDEPSTLMRVPIRLAETISNVIAGEVVVVPLKLLREAHACMRACGWQLAPAAEDVGDGVLANAVADVEERVRALLPAASADAIADEPPACAATAVNAQRALAIRGDGQ